MSWNLCNIRYESKIDPTTFEFTGGMQTYVVPATGIYKLEVWGAQGGTASGRYSGTYGTVAGGKGGYSVGNVSLLAGDTIYICIGGMGGNAQGYSGRNSVAVGGYNGGGHGREQYGDQNWGVGGGGGATHIGKTNTLLKDTSVSNLYIVAGGGGGGMMDTWTPTRFYPGAGGGLEGTGRGGTQTTAGDGGGFGYGGTGPSYGYGDGWRYAGGGGGYYGGGYSLSTHGVGGGGGSGYIGGVTNGTTTADQWTGHGMAIISKV